MVFDTACFEHGWDFINAGEQYRNLNMDTISQSDQLLMASLFKQATMGDMDVTLLVDDDENFKLCTAWQSLSGTPKHEAMIKYVDLSKELCKKYSSDH